LFGSNQSLLLGTYKLISHQFIFINYMQLLPIWNALTTSN